MLMLLYFDCLFNISVTLTGLKKKELKEIEEVTMVPNFEFLCLSVLICEALGEIMATYSDHVCCLL